MNSNRKTGGRQAREEDADTQTCLLVTSIPPPFGCQRRQEIETGQRSLDLWAAAKQKSSRAAAGVTRDDDVVAEPPRKRTIERESERACLDTGSPICLTTGKPCLALHCTAFRDGIICRQTIELGNPEVGK
ncbi:hypothetical protein AXG93_1409s1280 [Marchantia polymorpha subsp. ruderalis]|uniref:Uncharacterized protein n=1 Tax=Marchantia polymorpha subsp. ruderalis TaxID=1480154 RepID=A0A176WJS7_MARPO|nr:hypothetical protein AXG93_1409s1280 [Marchantia polymorpha subsp. ruderalis]